MSDFASLSAGMLGMSVKKVAGMVTVVLTSLAIPAAAIAMGPKGSAQVGEAINTASQIPMEVGSQIYSSVADPKTFSNEVSEVKEWVTKPLGTLKEKATPILDTTKTNYDVAEEVYGQISGVEADTINYYSFVGGEFTKAFIRTIPMIIRDSIRSTFHDTTQYKFISLQKIYKMLSVEEFKDAFVKLKELGVKRKQLFDQVTQQQANNVINILKGVKEDENSAWIKYFWKKISTNIQDIKDSDSINTSAELLEKIFIGKDTFGESINKLLCSVQAGEIALKSSNLEGITEESVKKLIEVLKQLQGTILGKKPEATDPTPTCQ